VKKTIKGALMTWCVSGDADAAPVTYVMAAVPYADAAELFKTEVFNGATGRGNQRVQVPPHVKKLKAAMQLGTYTPTPLSAIGPDADEVKVDAAGVATVPVDTAAPLDLVDGGHRMAALRAALEEAVAAEDAATADAIRSVTLPVFVYLGEDAKRAFLNLQAGRSVDANQMAVMRTRARDWPRSMADLMETALAVARAVSKEPRSPLCGAIAFDSRGGAPLKFSSLAQRSASDACTSLVGLARFACEVLKTDEVVDVLVKVYAGVRKNAPEALGEGGCFALPPAGTAAGAGLLVAAWQAACYRVAAADRRSATADDIDPVVDAVHAVNRKWAAKPPTSAQEKRAAAAEVFRIALEDIEGEEFECGVPKPLVDAYSPSAFPGGGSATPAEEGDAAGVAAALEGAANG
jgi:hypothetical protein